VVQLYKLLPVLKQCDLHSALHKLGFPVRSNTGFDLMRTEQMKFVRHDLVIRGTYTGDPFSYIGYAGLDVPYKAEVPEGRSFSLTLPVWKEF
jgi:hypothetical protein